MQASGAAAADEEEEVSSSSSSHPPTLPPCEVCGTHPRAYCSPRCSVKTCSLTCCKQHKATVGRWVGGRKEGRGKSALLTHPCIQPTHHHPPTHPPIHTNRQGAQAAGPGLATCP